MSKRRASSSKKSRSAADILAGNPRCIYCGEPATTVEHMPPRMVFRAKDRPSGLEFPACEPCNKGTSAADAAVAFFARIDQLGEDTSHWKVQESLKPLGSLASLEPGFVREIFDETNVGDTLFQTPGGVLMPVTKMNVGPIAAALLTVFTAKLGMALYREHVGEPLPLEGGVHTQWFLNSGLSQESAHAMLSILPAYNTLTQGTRKSASGQFDYRFNTDEKTITAAFTHFHNNIHFFTCAVADPKPYGFPRNLPFSALVKPGELLKLMPKPPPAILMPVSKPKLKSDWLILPR